MIGRKNHWLRNSSRLTKTQTERTVVVYGVFEIPIHEQDYQTLAAAALISSVSLSPVAIEKAEQVLKRPLPKDSVNFRFRCKLSRIFTTCDNYPIIVV